MSDPKKDFETIKDALPTEGQSIVLMRENGKLRVAKISVTPLKEGGIHEDGNTYGRLLTLNKRLTDVTMGCSLFFIMAFGAGWMVWSNAKTSPWYVYLGAVLFAGIIYTSIDSWYTAKRRKMLFLNEGIETIRTAALALQITENELLARINQSDKLDHVQEQLAQYLGESGVI